jgi:hypothetical protein
MRLADELQEAVSRAGYRLQEIVCQELSCHQHLCPTKREHVVERSGAKKGACSSHKRGCRVLRQNAGCKAFNRPQGVLLQDLSRVSGKSQQCDWLTQ